MSSAWVSTFSSGREPKSQVPRRTSVNPASIANAAKRESVASVSTVADDRKGSITPARAREQDSWWFGRAKWICLVVVIIVIAVVGTTLAVSFLTSRGTSQDSGNYWSPRNGATWQIDISNPITDTSVDAEVYDIDLYSNMPDVITELHNLNRKVICYFSAGTYDAVRPDHALFEPSDYGNAVDSTSGKKWLDTQAANVRAVMVAHLDLAVHKGCDGVDPDNTDAYLHDSGFPLTQETTLDYLGFLATETHKRNMSIGLKNNAAIVNQTVAMMQWEVNEVCEVFNECDLYKPFISAGKPVFHIVYSGDSNSVTDKDKYCSETSTMGFSTILKNFVLDNWVARC